MPVDGCWPRLEFRTELIKTGEPDIAIAVGLTHDVAAAVRSFVLAGLLAFAITPLALFLLDFPLNSVFGLSALTLLILVAHRKNIPEEIDKLMTGRKLKTEKRTVPK